MSTIAGVKSNVLLTVGLLTLVGAGCAYGELRQVLRAEFASETGCREVSIRRRDTWYAYSENFYKVSGCGKLRTYTCPAGDGLVSYGSSGCKWIEGDIDSPQNAKPASDPMTEPMPEEPSPPMMDEPSEPSPSESSDSSAAPTDDGLGASDLTGDASGESTTTETKGGTKKAGKVKASGGLKLGH